ncbi:MAG: hypothetical protein NW207_07285 [Cytophagales bacterium]|nr:hypothetical protein [Cytophagales bacterium]
MTNLFIILYCMTLIYLINAGRVLSYIYSLAIQGILLFAIVLSELKEMHLINLTFILLETLIFKGIIVPYYLYYLMKKNNIFYEREPDQLNFYSLFKIAIIFIISFFFGYELHINFETGNAYRLQQHTHEIIYFTASLSSILTGLLIIMRRKKIITHIVGYLVLENGLFMLSLAMGTELPIIINMGILFDILTTVFLLGVFLNRAKGIFKAIEIRNLTELKD